MKTRIFATNAQLHEDFKSDLHQLLALSDKDLSHLATEFVRVQQTGLSPLKNLDYSEIADFLEKRDKGTKAINDILTIIRFLFAPMVDVKERSTPDDVAADIIEACSLEEPQSTLLRNFLAILGREAAQKYTGHLLVQMTEKLGAPSFGGIGIAADLRSVVSNVYQFKDDVQRFQPQIEGFVVRGTISLILTSSKDEKIVFQVNEEELAWLLHSLTALQKQMTTTSEQAREHGLTVLQGKEL